jgi:F1F0 ATPase subunit 2
MHELIPLALPLGAGLALGAVFFGGLWWTVIRALSSRQPALWFIVSLLLRMSITLTGFFLVGRGNWDRWLACLLGFVVARFIVQLTRPSETACAP